MKLLRSTQRYMAILGIYRNRNLLNVKFLMPEIIFFTYVLQNWLFLTFVASTFREYTNSIFLTSTDTMAAACFTIFATKKGHIFKMIDIGKELIKKSE